MAGFGSFGYKTNDGNNDGNNDDDNRSVQTPCRRLNRAATFNAKLSENISD